MTQLISLFNFMKPIKESKTVISIYFGDGLDFESITLESLITFLLAASGKVKIQYSAIEIIVSRVLKEA